MTPYASAKQGLKWLMVLTLIWAVIRWLFFVGLVGYDDLRYVAYAAKFGALPTNHWEARLLFTGVIRLCIEALGYTEFAYTLPALFSSWLMLYVVFHLGWRFFGKRGGVWGGVLFALLPQDLFSSTSVDAVALTAAFSSFAFLILIDKPDRRGLAWAGMFFGLAMFSHVYALFVVAAATVAWFLHTAPHWRWREAFLLGGISLATFLCVNSAAFLILAGDPLLAFKVSAQTHLQTFGNIVYDLNWALWPLRAFFFTREFSLLLPIAAISLGLGWKQAPSGLRFLGLFSAVFYVYTNWGTQSPTQYLPLWHLPRYWYPIAVPICVLAGGAISVFPSRVSKFILGASAFIQLLLLLSMGPWGAQVEITKSLRQHALLHPDQTFVAEGYTLNEMFVLNACRPLINVHPLQGMPGPGVYTVADSLTFAPDRRPLLLLVNRGQTGRKGMAAYEELTSKGHFANVGSPQYRSFAYLLPASLRSKPWMLRHPSAELATLE